MKQIYLDYAAATPMSQACLQAMDPFFTDKFYNPSATYIAAKSVKKSVAGCRQIIAATIGARPSEIIFTAGGTEANNLAVQGVMRAHVSSNMIVSSIEHDSVIMPAKLYSTQTASVDNNGSVDIDKLTKLIGDETVLVSVGLVNHEIGVIQDIKEISYRLRQIRIQRAKNGNNLPLYLHTDAAQAGCYLDLHVARLGVDLMSVNGGKIYGPKQSGFLYVRTATNIQPLLFGGGQENSLRSGTENVAGIHGLAVALCEAQEKRRGETERVLKLNHQFANKLQKTLSGISINSRSKHSSPHIVSITISGVDNERVMMELDERGVMVALGSACSASNEKPSSVLNAIGLSDADARSTLRISFGKLTTEEDVTAAAETLAAVVKSQNR